jgi:hypothetical protein
MTAYRSYHLPPDDDPVQTVLDRLEALGLEALPDERNALAAVAVMGHLPALDRLIRRALLLGSVDGLAAQSRRMVRERREDVRPASHRATFRAPEAHPPEPRWVIGEDGTSFRHTACGISFGGYIDAMQTADAAADHHNHCPEVDREH